MRGVRRHEMKSCDGGHAASRSKRFVGGAGPAESCSSAPVRVAPPAARTRSEGGVSICCARRAYPSQCSVAPIGGLSRIGVTVRVYWGKKKTEKSSSKSRPRLSPPDRTLSVSPYIWRRCVRGYLSLLATSFRRDTGLNSGFTTALLV